MASHRNAPFQLTVVTKNDGILTKRLCLSESGELEKDSSECFLSQGIGNTVQLAGLHALPDLISSLQINQALVHGIVVGGYSEYNLTTKGRYYFDDAVTETPQGIFTTRTRDSFKFPKSAVTMFDYDPDPQAPDHTVMASPKHLMSVLSKVHPTFEDIAYVRSFSTSSGVSTADGRVLAPLDGMHIYVQIQDGSDIPRFGRVLQDRLWLAGFGYYKVAKDGSLLKRTIVDAMVHSPERLDFSAGAALADGLVQDFPTPEYVDGVVLDTQLVPDLTPEEQLQLADIQKAAAAEMEPLRQEVILKYRETEVRELIAQGRTEEQAKEIVTCRLAGVLSNDDLLHFDDGQVVAVGTVRIFPEKYDQMTMADPIYPEKGPQKAILYANSESQPIIHSFVGGDRNYLLMKQKRDIPQPVQADTGRVQNNRYLKPDPEWLEPGASLVRSAKGTGKTTGIAAALKEAREKNPDMRILVVTHRRSLAQALSKDFDVHCYLNKGLDVNHHSQLVISLDSIKNLVSALPYDVVVFDESEQGIRHLTGATLRKHVQVCLKRLKFVLRNAKCVICADADMSDLTKHFIQEIRGEEPRTFVNTWQTAKGRNIHMLATDVVAGEVMHHVRGGKGTYVATNSSQWGLNLRNHILRYYGIEAPKDSEFISQLPDGRKVICITSRQVEACGATLREYINSINEDLSEKDILIASPSLGTGVSIHAVNFPKIFFRFTGRAGTTPTDCSQQLFRVRRFQEAVGHIIDSPHTNRPVEKEDIERQLILDALEGTQAALAMELTVSDLGYYKLVDEGFAELLVNVTHQTNGLLNDFKTALVTQLFSEGYQILRTDTEGAHQHETEEFENTKADRKSRNLRALREAVLITDPEKLSELMGKETRTDEESNSIQKSLDAQLFGFTEDTDELKDLVADQNYLSNVRRALILFADEEFMRNKDAARLQNQNVMLHEKTHNFAAKQLLKEFFACLHVDATGRSLKQTKRFFTVQDRLDAYGVLETNANLIKAYFGMTVKLDADNKRKGMIVSEFYQLFGLAAERKGNAKNRRYEFTEALTYLNHLGTKAALAAEAPVFKMEKVSQIERDQMPSPVKPQPTSTVQPLPVAITRTLDDTMGELGQAAAAVVGLALGRPDASPNLGA